MKTIALSSLSEPAAATRAVGYPSVNPPGPFREPDLEAWIAARSPAGFRPEPGPAAQPAHPARRERERLRAAGRRRGFTMPPSDAALGLETDGDGRT
ncbi:MAG: hypothetical protein B9S34_05565 [Opitutia bacterium Tous-C1TDCM]|nr:MAG: hypothetical protein B9S34_05565 [Opitutae bacterium Tous-C1TDCM]